jgi:hypothetical protein
MFADTFSCMVSWYWRNSGLPLTAFMLCFSYVVFEGVAKQPRKQCFGGLEVT